MGELYEWAVVVVAEVCTAAGIDLWPSSRAGVAFLLFEEGGMTGSRPNERPTADAPTTVAVAQSCVTTMRQSRMRDTQSTTETRKLAPHSEAELWSVESCKGKGEAAGEAAYGGSGRLLPLEPFSFSITAWYAVWRRSLDEALVTRGALWHLEGGSLGQGTPAGSRAAREMHSSGDCRTMPGKTVRSGESPVRGVAAMVYR